MSGKFGFFVGILACLCLAALASIPSRSSLRFNEVSGNNLAPNSVGGPDVQDFAVRTHTLWNNAVTEAKVAPYAINSEQVAPGAITSMGASLDRVKLFIRNEDTVPAASQDANVVMPEDNEAVQPFEAIDDPTRVIVDSPNPQTSYRVEGKARGSGVILGWYPSRNGHLLRYQSSRALRGIVCSAIDVENVEIVSECECEVDTFLCECSVENEFIGVNFNSEIPSCGACTVLDCSSPAAALPDQNCQDRRPVDNELDFFPDNCGSYTSVSDVNNPQEGVPVYSPSVERITIDDNGVVEMWFFGRGTVTGPHQDIEITVVVLLDEQYGA